MPYGIVFQEFHQKWFNEFGKRNKRHIDRGSMVRLTWVLVAFLLGMAYTSNLKASLVSKAYQPSIKTINEMAEKLCKTVISHIHISYLYVNLFQKLDHALEHTCISIFNYSW